MNEPSSLKEAEAAATNWTVTFLIIVACGWVKAACNS
jgi:hypothetical protein